MLNKDVDANVHKNSSGNCDRSADCFGELLHIDFNFTRASSTNYRKVKGMKRIVKSRQGYTATLTLIDRKTRKLFAFPTAGKSPPLKILDAFLERYKSPTGRLVTSEPTKGGILPAQLSS